MTRHHIKYEGFIVPVCIAIILLGISVMIGWIYHIHIITTIKEGFASMKFNTAVSLILLSLSLLFITVPSKLSLRIAQLFALVALSIGILSFMQHILNYDLHIDRLFFSHAGENHTHLFVMSPHTAFCISALASAMLWIRTKSKVIRVVCQYFFHTVTLISFVVLIGYLYNVPRLHSLSLVSSMAVHTATAFILLGIAASLINPALGITGIFTGKLLGNLMARRLFSSMVAGIILAGYLRILSHRYEIVSVEFGIATLTVSFCGITLILIWIVSSMLNKASQKIQRVTENLNLVVQAAPFALILSDRDGNIIETNDRAGLLFGYTKEELESSNVSALVPEDNREEWMLKRKSFFTASSDPNMYSDEIFSIKKNGTVFPIEIILTCIKTEKDFRILSFVIDITARKSNEAIINKQLIELQSKNRELEQFNYISSHDLQEPLRTVLNYIQLLEEDYPDLNNEVKAHLKSMESSVTRMSTVVRSLLDFGRLGRNKKLVLTDCRKIIDEVIADLNTIVKNSGAVISIANEHVHIYAYETELRQLFQNLINNAIKFRKKDVVPHINISCRELNGYYEFAVSDNGIGIRPKYFEKIFDIFQRLNKESEFEGHGVGLANCKKIAEMHGGKIWVESEPGKGSTFLFTILNIKP